MHLDVEAFDDGEVHMMIHSLTVGYVAAHIVDDLLPFPLEPDVDISRGAIVTEWFLFRV